MRVLFYLNRSEAPVKSENIPERNIPSVGDTVVMQDGKYRIEDVLVGPSDDIEENIVTVDITTEPLIA